MKKFKSLAEYLTKTGTTQEALATRLGVTRPYISMIAAGDRQPSLALAIRIEEETGVPAAAMVMEKAS